MLFTVAAAILIGIGAIMLNCALVGAGSIIAAGTLVTERSEIPPLSVVMGAPAKVKRAATAADFEMIRRHAENYIGYRQTYLEER